MVKIFLAYVWLFSGGLPVGAIHLNDVYKDYPACVKGLEDAATEIKTFAQGQGVSIVIPKCVELDVPEEIKASN